jgi:plasmid stability protein
MPAKNPRISSVIDLGLWKWLRSKAAHEGISVSLLVRDILINARNEEEEQYWAAAGEERLDGFERDQSLSHEDVWSSER